MECCKSNSLSTKIKEFLNIKKENNFSKKISARIALVGNPNVGKSVIFNSLTGAYVDVSNYPGTTVEVSRGIMTVRDMKVEVIDTPGMYSLLPITEEERVARKLLLTDKIDLVIHVADAKNIKRMLPMTLQLQETGLNMVLVLNIMDEAEAVGVKIDVAAMENLLGIPVIAASAAKNRGIVELVKTIGKRLGHNESCSKLQPAN